MISIDNTFTLNRVTSQLCMRHDAAGQTTAVLAVIRHRATGARDSPPACGNDYDTAELPFAKGHLVALELGGSDHRYNVVPQFEHWQGKPNGAWRQMERELRADHFNGCPMLVEVGYGRAGAVEEHDAAVAAFHLHRIRDWTDPRIPDGFRVRVWPARTGIAAITDDGGFEAVVTQLERGRTLVDSVFTLGAQMPEPDRGMYITQFALDAAYALHEDDMRDDSLVPFLLEPGTLARVRQRVAALPGVTPVEAAGLQALPIICDYQAGMTEAKVRRLLNLRLRQRLATASWAEVGVRQHSGKRGAADDADAHAGAAKRRRPDPS